MTLTDRIIAYMLEHGYVETESPSRKYRAFKMTVKSESTRRYFIGRKGGVRASRTGKISDSFSVTDMMKGYMEKWEKGKKNETNHSGMD